MERNCKHGADRVCDCGTCFCGDCFPGPACPDCIPCDECAGEGREAAGAVRLGIFSEGQGSMVGMCVDHAQKLAVGMRANPVSSQFRWLGSQVAHYAGKVGPDDVVTLIFDLDVLLARPASGVQKRGQPSGRQRAFSAVASKRNPVAA